MMQEYDPCVNRDHTVPPFWRNMLLPFFGMRFDVQDRCMEKKYRNGGCKLATEWWRPTFLFPLS